MGNGFWGIDGAKIRRYDAMQAQAKRPRPGGPPQAQKTKRTHSTVQIAQTEKSLRKSLDSRIQPCYDATIPSGTVECKPPDLNLENLHGHRPGKNTGGVS